MTNRIFSGRCMPLRCVAVSALVVLLQGCFQDKLVDFTPKRGSICDDVRITGTIYHIGNLDGVWFNGLPANASIRNFPPPSGPYEIQARVPEGATTGPLRASISTGGGIFLGVVGTDQTFPDNFEVIGSPAVPTISSFTATPNMVKAGESSTLSWTVGPATSLSINATNVLGSSSKVVSPTATTVYTLTALNSCLMRSATTTVTVAPPISLTINPTSLLVERGKSATTTAKIPTNSNTVEVSCPTAAGVSCATVNLPTGVTSASLTVSASATAPFGKTNVAVTASELVSGGAKATSLLQVTVGRATGNFAEVTSAATGTIGTVITAPSGACSATVASGVLTTPKPLQAILKCGPNSFGIPYAIGGKFGLGGVGFSANSGLAVVTTWNNPVTSGIAQPITFITGELPGVVTTHTPRAFGVYEYQPGTATGTYVQPRFFVSPDATLAIAVGANIAGTTSLPSYLTVHDLTTGSLLSSIAYKISFTAKVETQGTKQVVSITPDGGTAVTVAIP